MDLEDVRLDRIGDLTNDELLGLAQQYVSITAEDRQFNAVRYFEPSQPAFRDVLESDASTIAVFGGNRSGKTENVLALMAALCTGVFPKKPEVNAWCRKNWRGPRKVRMVLESLTTVLHPIMLPKLQWKTWTGLKPQGGEQGHWGWIPRESLIDEKWDKSWSEKLRTLTVLCRDPDDPEVVLGESMIQFMSHDQDWSDFASGAFDDVLHDEPPPYMIWKENQARVLDVNGRIWLMMTWPDDPAIAVDWIYDEVYDPGTPGPTKDPEIDVVQLRTLENRFLDREGVAKRTAGWSEQSKLVKLGGQPLRFSNRIHPHFTDVPLWWSFQAGKVVIPIDGLCPETGSDDIVEFCHVQSFDHSRIWPVVRLLDPHPRKPHSLLYVQVNPNDDYDVVADLEVADEPSVVHEACERLESELGLIVGMSLMDPNMGAAPSGARREVSWQDEFAAAGLSFELADDSDVGRGRLNDYLKPDEDTYWPRIRVHARCQDTIFQMKRYVWDEHKKDQGRDVKQKPRAKYDDYPSLLKYFMNALPTFSMLHAGAPILKRPGKRRGR